MVAIVNVEGSSLHGAWPMTRSRSGPGPEQCVLSTKSFTAKLALLVLTGYAMAGRLAEGQARSRPPPTRWSGSSPTIAGPDRPDRRHLRDRAHLFVIGRGASYPLALRDGA